MKRTSLIVLAIVVLPAFACAQTVTIGAEVSYAVYGQRYEYAVMGMDFEGEYRQRALQLPLLLKFAAGRSGGLYAVVGPTVSFLTDAFDEDKNPFDTNTFQTLIGYGFHVQ